MPTAPKISSFELAVKKTKGRTLLVAYTVEKRKLPVAEYDKKSHRFVLIPSIAKSLGSHSFELKLE